MADIIFKGLFQNQFILSRLHSPLFRASFPLAGYTHTVIHDEPAITISLMASEPIIHALFRDNAQQGLSAANIDPIQNEPLFQAVSFIAQSSVVYNGCQKYVPKTWPTIGQGARFNRFGMMTISI